MERASKQQTSQVFWRTWAFLLLVLLLLLRGCSRTQAAVYHKSGICTYKDQHFKPGETFYKACDKCYCHHFGFFCYPPKKPTSWPKKCERIPTECGYRVVYRDNHQMECRAYSWIG